jgi:hypothetical protein
MNRRGFLSFLGTGAAIGAVAPSMVWPFRKYLFPATTFEQGGIVPATDVWPDDDPRVSLGEDGLYHINWELTSPRWGSNFFMPPPSMFKSSNEELPLHPMLTSMKPPGVEVDWKKLLDVELHKLPCYQR